MKLTIRKSRAFTDWYLIERAEHDGRTWYEDRVTEYGMAYTAFMSSARISDADVEGTADEMLAIADAIVRRDEVWFTRCAVNAGEEPVRFCSPRNSSRDGECSLAEADELTVMIREMLYTPEEKETPLGLFNRISAILEVELSDPPTQMLGLANLQANPEARLKSVLLRVDGVLGEEFRPLTQEEMDSIALTEQRVVLESHGMQVEHTAPTPAGFSIADMLKAVEETERRTRGQSEWFGGIDVHHVFFEGIYDRGKPGVWEIAWGS